MTLAPITLTRPILAHVYEPRRFEPCWVQPKLNGIRALYSKGRMWSRDLHYFHPSVVSHILSALSSLPNDVTLDGELYVHGWSLGRINGAIAVKRTEPTADSPLVCYHSFGLVSHQPFAVRYGQLKGHLEFIQSDKVKLVPAHWVETIVEADQLYEDYVSNLRYEGLMYYFGSDGYPTPKCRPGVDKNNRSYSLLKRKGWLEREWKIIGVEPGSGKRDGMLGAFICETDEGKEFNVGTGLGWTVEELTRLWNDPPIGQRLTVRYVVLTEDNIPQPASAIGVRDYE